MYWYCAFAGKGYLKDNEPPAAGIYASISLPSLNVGSVGGGTNLATQKECLQLIECYGKVSLHIIGGCFMVQYLPHSQHMK